MATYTQENRILKVSSPLGADVLLLKAFAGREQLSRPFTYRLELLSENGAIAAKDIVGKAVAWCVQHVDREPRWFHGLVRSFEAGPIETRALRAYRAEVVPWLWFLTRSANCRIFQNQTAPQIITKVFDVLQFSDYKLSLAKSYPKRDYCVQYRESAFDFVSRLMEYEGIFYFFTHEEAKHTLVLADAAGMYFDCPESPVTYARGTMPQNHVSSWTHRYEFRSGKSAQTDYNFETPAANLLASSNTIVDQPGAAKFELFDYPGLYQVAANGTAEVKVRMEEEETAHNVAEGASRCCTFTPGGKFTLEGHDSDAENQSYVLIAVDHSASDQGYSNTGAAAEYGNTFTCIPDNIVFRPARVTPRPIVRGPQTAVVVGPQGEEIYTDKYGRVKVQFFWDRLGKNDENSSCWIRVAENWAGKNWGIVFNPRIGQEVVVDFLEGDPDRPIITGRVYNAAQMPPYELPANKTLSVIKTRSSPEGTTADFNELRFEDKKDKEQIYFHAQKDFDRVVENNDTLKVGSDKADDGSQTIEIWMDRTETVKTGNETITVEKGNRLVTIKQGNETLHVDTGNREVVVKTGNDTHKITTGNREVKIESGNDTLTITAGNQTITLNAGASTTEAMQSITLKVGENSIKIEQSGITISGLNIKIEGQVQTEVKGVMTQVSADGILELKGSLIKIN